MSWILLKCRKIIDQFNHLDYFLESSLTIVISLSEYPPPEHLLEQAETAGGPDYEGYSE